MPDALPVRRLKRIEDLRIGSIVSFDGQGGQTVIYDASAGIDNRASTNDETYNQVRAIARKAGLI